MTFRVARTNQYNRDLGLIHSTNGNHLESPNEGSSIDHQGPINADPPPAKPTEATTQGPKHRKATAGSYKLDQRYSTPSNSTESSKQLKTGFKKTSEKRYQTKRLSKRSPTLPLSLSSELPTVGNCRR
ncbi:BTB/POZ domain-containing protein [Dorcoceras hygrometricum]|uniref:BTB/POZ domain-containing protein n=1 Tax=Dorcoceras hygrometricum TaxID=472368 RepID=A0A2Z7AUK3_9LAMI|nr:BTB/POZ domain-containing protein [Dorcoceras hygrometricum]